jgi:four helix bundle protein
MKIERFEDLEIWQEARILSKRVYEISSKKPFCYDFKLRDQIRGSSGSAMDNIAEGFNRQGNKEFSQFLYVTLGSAGEVRSQSYRAYDVKFIDEVVFQELMQRTESLCRKTFNLIQYLKNSDFKGPKFS